MPALAFKLDARAPEQHRIHVTLALDLAALDLAALDLAAPRKPTTYAHPQSASGGAKSGQSGREVVLFLPAWTPGSYLVRDYARHLEALAGCDGRSGRTVPSEKVAKNRFCLHPEADCEQLQVSYTVYCHELTVRTADLTSSHAFWNGACVCLWPVGAPGLDATLEVQLPDGWQVVTQLEQIGENPPRFAASDLDEVVDAPFLAGDELEVLRFEVAGRPHSFVLDGLAGLQPPASLVPDTERVIAEAAAIFGGEVPYPRYDFLALFSGEGRGGLEHTRSSVLMAPRTTFAPRTDYEDFLGLVAHEFFHVWNVKRMRPAGLWEFDYENENYTTLLWVAEGATAYYDDHLCLRAGVLSAERYLELVGRNIAAMYRTPGRLLHPLATASFDAWIKLYRPDENSRNSTQSYYTHGALAMLCIDLRIRCATSGQRSLDDAMADLYRSTFEQGRGYTDADVQQALSRAAGQDLEPLVRSLVGGPFDPDFDEFLQPAGLQLTTSDGERPYLGVQLAATDLVLSSVLTDTPAYEAGLCAGDEILAMAGLRVSRATWGSTLQSLWEPGKSIEVLLSRRGRILQRAVTPARTPFETCRVEAAPSATEAEQRIRQQWLWLER